MNIYFIFTLLFFFMHHCYSKGVVCDTDKGFICYDDTSFFQCVHNGKEKPGLITGELQSCPAGLLCKDNSDLECSY